MLFLVLFVFVVFFLAYGLATWDHQARGSQEPLDHSKSVFWAHSILFSCLFLRFLLFDTGFPIFSYSWTHLVVLIFSLNFLTQFLHWIDPSSMVMFTLINVRQVFASILLIMAATIVIGYPHIWPHVEHFGWTGDFRGIMLFIIPVYNIAFVGTHQDLISISFVGLTAAFILHMLFFVTGLNYVSYQLDVWFCIVVCNFVSFLHVFNIKKVNELEPKRTRKRRSKKKSKEVAPHEGDRVDSQEEEEGRAIPTTPQSPFVRITDTVHTLRRAAAGSIINYLEGE